MQLKNIINKYIKLNSFYERYHKKLNFNYKKELIKTLENNLNKENYSFYIIKLSQDDRTWQSNMCLSLNESKALEAFYINKQNKKNLYLLEFKSPKKSEIIKLSLKDILKDEKLIEKFIKRIKLIPTYKKENIINMKDNCEIEILWNFSHRLEARYFYYQKDSFTLEFFENEKLPFYIDKPYIEVINNKGKYGLIYKHSTTQEDRLNLIYKCIYNHIETKGILAQIQTNKRLNTQNYKDVLCTIVNLKTNDIYTNNALCDTLNQNSFIEISKNKKLRYIKIDAKTYKICVKSKEYDNIINSTMLNQKPVFDKKQNLWGYINKYGEEIIKPQFKTYAFFNSDYAVINEDEKYLVIDSQGKIQIDKKEFIKAFKDDIFFVKKSEKYAIYKKGKVIIDYLDINKRLEELKNEQNLKEEDLIKYLKKLHRKKTYQFTQEKNPVFLLLELELIKKKATFVKNKYDLSLDKYIRQFEIFEKHLDLNTSELSNQKVKVKACEILKEYKDIIIDPTQGRIGFRYPMNQNIFDMKKELPIEFKKNNNEILTLGIEFKYLELVK